MNTVIASMFAFCMMGCAMSEAPENGASSDGTESTPPNTLADGISDSNSSPTSDSGNEDIATPSTAEAMAALSSCPGTRIEHIPMKSGLATYAFLDIYYDRSSGRNCAMTVSAGSAAGHATSIEVFLTRCRETSPSTRCTVDGTPQIDPNPSDPGPFHTFAGPVLVSAPGKCIYAYGYLKFNSVEVFAQLPGASHCG